MQTLNQTAAFTLEQGTTVNGNFYRAGTYNVIIPADYSPAEITIVDAANDLAIAFRTAGSDKPRVYATIVDAVETAYGHTAKIGHLFFAFDGYEHDEWARLGQPGEGVVYLDMIPGMYPVVGDVVDVDIEGVAQITERTEAAR
jgi:hypothetical protein